jgi:hypothetical protein
MVLYIRHLLYGITSKQGVDGVISKLRKLHWEDPNVRFRSYSKLHCKELTSRTVSDCSKALQRIYESMEDQVQQYISVRYTAA